MSVYRTAIVIAALTAGLAVAHPPAPGSPLLFAQASVPTPQAGASAGARAAQYLSRLAAFGFSGAVLVAQDGKVVLEQGYGLANRARGVPYTPGTVSTIGSITKMFTAAAILKLEMQGRLHVEDPIAKYLPEVPPDKTTITIHELLTHTGGLRADYGGRDSDPIGRDDLVKLVLTTPLLSAPGSRHVYSNEGYSLLGAIVERVSGQSYEQYLRENIFTPAGMNDTGYVLPRWSPDRVAHGYTEDGDWGTMPEKGWREDGPGWYLKANGGLHSTVGDLYRWHLALQGDTVLSAAAREKYTKPYVAEGPLAQSFYAYGWAVFATPRKTTLVAHNGGNGVFAADFRRYIDEKTVVIAMSNGEMPAIDVTPTLEAVIFGQPFAMPPAVAPLSPEPAATTLARLAGTYQLAAPAISGTTAISGGTSGLQPGSITVTVDGTALLLASTDPRAFALLNFLDPPGDARFSDLEARSRTIIEAGARGDFNAVRQAMGTDRPVERIAQNQGAMWKDRRGRIGEFRGVEIAGSGRGPAGRIVYVRIAGERGSEFVQFGWEAGEMMMMRPLDALPQARLLPGAPATSGSSTARVLEFVGFRLPGKIVRARFDLGSDLTPVAVTLAAAGGDTLRAERK
jgi:CubicO group peptidase (beta-lactamase class C family)